jgi:hypothetical protein
MPSQLELTYRSHAGGLTQCDLIAQHLQQRVGQWVPMTDLWRVSGAFAVHSRISDLRQRGYDIDHHNQHINGVVHSYYRLSVPSVPSVP